MGELETKGQEDDQLSSEFAASGRTGRRNAVPDVDVQGIDPDAIKLAERLSNINTANDDVRSSTSGTSHKTTGFRPDSTLKQPQEA
ncbi:unnamed protein product [Toxocara canis]|uniref:CHZ domain-containing protein n=1 Tax=Toxocara canis TaxID=6265 RepID=A0A183UAZ5_TOXCA|nr:unnamed protein product [Toxocara canis]